MSKFDKRLKTLVGPQIPEGVVDASVFVNDTLETAMAIAKDLMSASVGMVEVAMVGIEIYKLIIDRMAQEAYQKSQTKEETK